MKNLEILIKAIQNNNPQADILETVKNRMGAALADMLLEYVDLDDSIFPFTPQSVEPAIETTVAAVDELLAHFK